MVESLGLPTVMDVSESTTVKNTFLDWVAPTEVPKRRCNSVPRSWMPGEFCIDSSCTKSVDAEDETTASYSSEKELLMPSSYLDSPAGSDNDSLFGASFPHSNSSSDSACLESDAESIANSNDIAAASTKMLEPLVELRLLDFVGDVPPAKQSAQAKRTKLRVAAQPFAAGHNPAKLDTTAQPFAPMFGIQMVIQAAKDVLESDPSVAGVQMSECAMGGTWTMIAHTVDNAAHKPPSHYLKAAKTALLSSAEHSQDTCIMGYATKPFTKIDKFSFSTTLAVIPACQQNSVCWDSYKNGFCPRRITCRWTHPCETQVMRLVIRIQPSFGSFVHQKNKKNEKSSRLATLPDDTEEFSEHLAMLQHYATMFCARFGDHIAESQ